MSDASQPPIDSPHPAQPVQRRRRAPGWAVRRLVFALLLGPLLALTVASIGGRAGLSERTAMHLGFLLGLGIVGIAAGVVTVALRRGQLPVSWTDRTLVTAATLALLVPGLIAVVIRGLRFPSP